MRILLATLLVCGGLLLAAMPLVTCGRCSGRGTVVYDFKWDSSLGVPCERCCPHGLIEPGRKVSALSNRFPKHRPVPTVEELSRVFDLPKIGPNGLLRYQGFR